MRTSTKEYAQALYELTKDKNSEEIKVVIEKFVQNLKERKLLGRAKKIMNKFEEIYNKKNGIVEAKVQTARELDQISQEKIIEFIKNKYQAEDVGLMMEIIPELKGGLKIIIGNEVTDKSVLGRLTKLRNKLVG